MDIQNSKLYQAAVAFEKSLPKTGWTHINTRENWSYGELHRVFYDLTNLDDEDQELVAVVKPFVQQFTGRPRVSMTPNHYDPEVVALRNFLETHQ